MKKLLTSLACGALPLVSAAAQTCGKQSPAHTVALIELYTSEGCSSCPPADRFLRSLRDGTNAENLVPDRAVPLALHVDYWDYIGWKDAFAKPEFTKRQRWLTARGNTKTIYTPEFFVNGREVREWSTGIGAAVKRINEQPARADVGITIGAMADGALQVEVRAKSAMESQLFVALYENRLTSDVHAGENQGAVLRHDYVVREWLGPMALTGNGSMKTAEFARKLVLPEAAKAKNLGVAAFVQRENGEVLQTVAAGICGEK